MDSRITIFNNTAALLLGELIGSTLVVAGFAAFQAFSWVVVVSTVVGSLVITANYFAMSIILHMAADRAEAGKLKEAQQAVKLSSTVRLAAMGAVLLISIKLGANVVALLAPLLFMRPVLMFLEFFRKKGD